MRQSSFTLIRHMREFRSCARAVAAVEFSLLVPMLLTLGVAGGEVFRFLSIQKRVAAASEAVAMMLSQAPTDITADDHQFMANAIRLMVPEVDHDARARGVAWNSILRVGMASLRFEPRAGCNGNGNGNGNGNCAFDPVVKWTVGDRACGVAQYRDQVGVGAVPRGFINARGTLVVADVRYDYRPLVFNNFMTVVRPMTIYRSVFLPPRYLDFVGVRWAPGSNARRCPGYFNNPAAPGRGGPPGLAGGGPPGLAGGGPPGLARR